MLVRHRVIAIVAAWMLLAGCSTAPQSEAVTGPDTTDSPPAASTAPDQSSAPAEDSPAPTSSPTATPASAPATPTDVPPKPGNPTFVVTGRTEKAPGTLTVKAEITWSSPAGLADAFLAYGITDCLRYSQKYDHLPCVVTGMKIPAATLKLIGKAPADARSMTISWEEGEAGPGPYWSILLRATNSFGKSIFTIVHSEDVCFECTY